MSSRERLDMDRGRTTSNGLTFKQRKGFFVARWTLGILVILAILVIVAVGLLVAYLTPCNAKNYSNSSKSEPIVDSSTEKLYVLLPRSIIPDHYVVELQPYILPSNFTFNGEVTVTVNCTEDTNNITLHINDISVHEETVKLVGATGNSAPEIQNVEHDKRRQFFILNLKSQLKAGERYNVSMKFRGNLNDQLAGFYRSSYETASGEKRWLATTQFQPTDARRAFPCFDEPSLKATFDITLVKMKNMTALSNMPPERTEPRGEWEAVVFRRTVPMSTYLLAFIVCDYKSNKTDKMAIWTREDALPTAQYALETGSFILGYFEKFFNVSFPLPKMDMISIPDFSAGAMENWGLITYRETALLYDPKISSARNKQRIAAVVSHELAHQWFGNLVTPKWWDDLWLNEGFASYVENIGVQERHPEWEMQQQFVVDDLQEVLEMDSLKSSHPISVPVGNPDEINEIFDSISYEKGASIIRMMYYFLGNETFRRGLTNYLRNKSYSNAVQDDLWKFLTDAQTNKSEEEIINVKTVMDSWTLQTGYPLVTLTRDYNSDKGNVTQTRFFLDNTAKDNKSYSWEVPITYTDSLNTDWTPTTKLWLHRNNGTVNNLPSSDHWVILNLQEVGYYRANYDEHNWKLLVDQLQKDHEKIDVVNRAQILDDLMDLARAQVVDYDLALNATRYLNKEKSYIPWEAALNSLSYLASMLSRSSIYGKWKKYIVKQLQPLYQDLQWDEDIDRESILKQYLRINVLVWMCKYDYPECVEEAKNRFQKWKQNPENVTIIPPNFRSIVYCTAIRHGNQEEWDFAWEQFKKAKIASEKDKLMNALACSREPWLLSRYLEWSITPNSGIRRQDGSYAFRAIARNIYGRDIAFNYFRDKWDDIYKIYGKSFFAFSNLVSAVTGSLNTQFEIDQLKSFYDVHKNELGTAQRAFQQAMESSKANVVWMEHNFKSIKNWLDVVISE